MHAIHTGGECHIQPIVDDTSRRRRVGGRAKVGGEDGEVGGVQVALAQLNQIHSGVHGTSRLRGQAGPPRVE